MEESWIKSQESCDRSTGEFFITINHLHRSQSFEVHCCQTNNQITPGIKSQEIFLQTRGLQGGAQRHPAFKAHAPAQVAHELLYPLFKRWAAKKKIIFYAALLSKTDGALVFQTQSLDHFWFQSVFRSWLRLSGILRDTPAVHQQSNPYGMLEHRQRQRGRLRWRGCLEWT